MNHPLGAAVGLLLAFAPLTVVAGPYDPKPSTRPYGEVTYGETWRAYSGATLVSPNGHQAAPRDFGDQGRGIKKNRDGSTKGCLVSRYNDITYSRCDPRLVTPADKPGQTAGTVKKPEQRSLRSPPKE